MAAALALLDLPPCAKLPPLECLFTVDEETGLTGGWPGLWVFSVFSFSGVIFLYGG